MCGLAIGKYELEKNLGVLADNKLKSSRQSWAAANKLGKIHNFRGNGQFY